MDDFKIQIFKEEQPEGLLQFTTLNTEDSKWVIGNMLKVAGMSGINTEQLYTFLFKSLKNEVSYDHEVSVAFLKNLLLTKSDIPPDTLCFVFWDYENGIDLFEVEELLLNWDYIWYDKSDEAMILYFPSQEKLILITDHGVVKTN
jgi:hypothetical protein